MAGQCDLHVDHLCGAMRRPAGGVDRRKCLFSEGESEGVFGFRWDNQLRVISGSGVEACECLVPGVCQDQEAFSLPDAALPLLGLGEHHEAPVARGEHQQDGDSPALLPGLPPDGGWPV